MKGYNTDQGSFTGLMMRKEVDDVPYRRGCNDGGRIGVACGNFCSEQKNIKRLDCQKGDIV